MRRPMNFSFSNCYLRRCYRSVEIIFSDMSISDVEQSISKKNLTIKSQNFSIDVLITNKTDEKSKIRERQCNTQNSAFKASTNSPLITSKHYKPFGVGELYNSGVITTADGIVAELHPNHLWDRFYQVGNEMIVNKSGRRMFPPLKIRFKGLHEDSIYDIWIEMHQTDCYRYKYHYSNSKWIKAGIGEQPLAEPYRYHHPESPATGCHWMSQVITFDKLKLTNSKEHLSGHVFIHSMHKYIPWINIQMVQRKNDNSEGKISFQSLQFAFPETEFVAVTAYQNPKIIKLKVNHNPFAKGFREVGKRREIPMTLVPNPLLYPVSRFCSCRKAVYEHLQMQRAFNPKRHRPFEYSSPSWDTPLTHHPLLLYCCKFFHPLDSPDRIPNRTMRCINAANSTMQEHYNRFSTGFYY